MFSSGSLRSYSNYRKPGLCSVIHRWYWLQPKKKKTGAGGGESNHVQNTKQLECSEHLGVGGTVLYWASPYLHLGPSRTPFP